MGLRKRLTIMFVFLLFAGYVNSALAQHYIFIEAEGQQPFYLKRNGETYSSNASGFIILSKITENVVDVIIGFPNRVYPEFVFKISGLEKDKGFRLKRAEKGNWVLLDHITQNLVLGKTIDQATAATSDQAISSSSFAQLLSETTGDKTLLDKSWSLAGQEKSTLTQVKTNSAPSPLKPVPVKPLISQSPTLTSIKAFIQSDNDNVKRIMYVEKGLKGKLDTIFVEIEKQNKETIKPLSFSEITNSMVEKDSTIKAPLKQRETDIKLSTNVVVGCTNPVAMPRDLSVLQRKMGRASSDQEQLEIIVSAFGQKCFTSKQAGELGSVFVDEQKRIELFAKIKNLVSDPALFGELEQTFLQPESIKVFRELLKKQ